MNKQINAQYNYAPAESLSIRVAAQVRWKIFEIFFAEFQPKETDTVLDIGVTSDRTYSSSNCFEALYPFKHRLVAAGIDDASFLEELYPGVRFQYANVMALPYPDRSFDLVHAAAVWEHVGSRECQAKMLGECLRVARRGVFLTTPNRWFPVEFHTQLPLLHWLPQRLFRNILKRTAYSQLADESNLNLLTPKEVMQLALPHTAWEFRLRSARLFGWPSNILLMATRGG